MKKANPLRKCRRCGERKPKEVFVNIMGEANPRGGYCSDCHSIRVEERKQAAKQSRQAAIESAASELIEFVRQNPDVDTESIQEHPAAKAIVEEHHVTQTRFEAFRESLLSSISGVFGIGVLASLTAGVILEPAIAAKICGALLAIIAGLSGSEPQSKKAAKKKVAKKRRAKKKVEKRSAKKKVTKKRRAKKKIGKRSPKKKVVKKRRAKKKVRKRLSRRR